MKKKLTESSKLKDFDLKLENSILQLKKLDNFDFESFETVSRLISEQSAKTVMIAADEKVRPDSKQGQSILDKFDIIRKIGNKFANMFQIEFKITFCGVVLCHLLIPKLQTDNSKDNGQ